MPPKAGIMTGSLPIDKHAPGMYYLGTGSAFGVQVLVVILVISARFRRPRNTEPTKNEFGRVSAV
jgi:hypothetical protein